MEKLQEGYCYHIFNRGINSGLICLEPADYSRFLESLTYYLIPAFNLFCYCVLNNHFHLLVRVKTDVEQKADFELISNSNSGMNLHGYDTGRFKTQQPARQMGHFLNSYTRYLNHRITRTGSLFEGRFKRKIVREERYLRYLVCYIHRNPIHHKLTDSYLDYPYSSYGYFLSNHNTFLSTGEVLKWFGGRENFIESHDEMKRKIEPELLLE